MISENTWSNSEFAIGLDRNGQIASIQHPADAHRMNWVSSASPLAWGIPVSREGGRLVAWPAPVVEETGEHRNTLRYTRSTIHGNLQLRVVQILHEGRLKQSYTLTNTTSSHTFDLAEADFGIRVPLADDYPDAATCMIRRCHAHVWAGGKSAWICALRMGAKGPHLGLVTALGAVTAYSITDRPWHSNDRGIVVLHPGSIKLAPGESTTFAWRLFWHNGWDDFFNKALAVPGFVRLQADHYTVPLGESLRVTAMASESLAGTGIYLNGQQLPVRISADGKSLQCEHVPTVPGDHVFQLHHAGATSQLRAFVSPAPLDLIKTRVRFLIEHQQCNAPDDPMHGAFLTFDTETYQQFYSTQNDFNAARERVGMGVLLALYLPLCDDPALGSKIRASLERFWRYVTTQLQDETGYVYNDYKRSVSPRLYNFPWVARLHLAMYANDPSPKYLDAYVRTVRAYYKDGGRDHYPINLPVVDGLKALRDAGRETERADLVSLIRDHAENLLAIGTNMPKHEVNYEQSIVGPACQVFSEMHLALATPGDRRYLDACNSFLELLLAFNGRQPDHHLHDIAIRHWDGYWFGKRRLYGDTFPHYWSTITALVLANLAKAEPERAQELHRRALDIVANNFSLFRSNGEASAAYLYPLTVNDSPGAFYDPYANDQDWGLVHYLLITR